MGRHASIRVLLPNKKEMKYRFLIAFVLALVALAFAGVISSGVLKEKPIATTHENDDQKVQVIVHLYKDTYSIGEAVTPRLEIKNNEDSLIEVQDFVLKWDKWAFSNSSAAHLVGPDGRDLMLPYRQPTPDAGYGPPIRVEARKNEWLILPISSHLFLREPGNYTFWIELGESQGRVHESNRVSFQLTDVPSSAPPDRIELKLEPAKSTFSTTEKIEVDVTFTSKSDEPLIFLKPQQDSFDGWVNPVYRFRVMAGAGRGLGLALRDGDMATPIYDESAQFTVALGGSYRQRLTLPEYPEMRKPGEYKIGLTYIVREKAIGKGGVVLDRDMNWPDEVFKGRLESNEITIKIE